MARAKRKSSASCRTTKDALAPGQERTPLFIDFPAVGDAGDGHRLVIVLDDVNDAIVADAGRVRNLCSRAFLLRSDMGGLQNC